MFIIITVVIMITGIILTLKPDCREYYKMKFELLMYVLI